jgi:GMP synthase-like glutamine amidotransferase
MDRESKRRAGQQPLRVGLVDMNNGHENQAMRCLRLIATQFHAHAAKWNPGLELQVVHVSPRDKGELPPEDCDMYLSSGGPGSPYEDDAKAWVAGYSRFLDNVIDETVARGAAARAVFAVCFSFEMIIRHFKVAEMAPRAARKFGVMPIYTTAEGRAHPLLASFGERLFAFEHRNWEAVGLDDSVLARNGGKLLARESREGRDDKGEAVMGLDCAPGIECVQFHPEADRPGVVAWVARPDQAAAFKEAYGEETYERMLKTLDDPSRLARTFAMLIPGWMVRKFNLQSDSHGWNPVGAPVQDMQAFGSGRAQDLTADEAAGDAVAATT